MDIRSFSRESVQNCIQGSIKADKFENIRIIFSPTKIHEGNFNQACQVYGAIYGDAFDNVIIIEDSDEFLKKRLPMSSHDYYETPFGTVQVNDKARNELCDEEDDFFVDDVGFHSEMSLFHQLMMLQCALGDFKVVSVQISKDERPAILRELAAVVSELHDLRNTLIVFCCDLESNQIEEFKRLQEAIETADRSNLLNAAFSEEATITGRAAFIAGVLVAHKWDLGIEFIRTGSESDSLLAGIAFKAHA
jgi:AmmeMemoRadiSam system protein B